MGRSIVQLSNVGHQIPRSPRGVDYPNAIGSIVPKSFEEFVRVVNPARVGDRRVSWPEVAELAGSSFTGMENWNDLAKGLPERLRDDVVEPESGSIESRSRFALAGVLDEFTIFGERCNFAIWHGYAGLESHQASEKIEYGANRQMLVLSGPLSLQGRIPNAPLLLRVANCWWPASGSWWVGGDIYSRSVIVGGSRSCVRQILDSPDIESYRMPRYSGISLSDL